MGYDARVHGDVAELLQHAPSSSPLHRLGQATSITLHQLFDTPGGAEFWRAHGKGFHGEFDPTLDLPHRRRLNRVCYEKVSIRMPMYLVIPAPPVD